MNRLTNALGRDADADNAGRITTSGRIRRTDADVPASTVELCRSKCGRVIGSETGCCMHYSVSEWTYLDYPDPVIRERVITGVIYIFGIACRFGGIYGVEHPTVFD